MSGLLMRLGAQATGQGWAVRSDVRLPFASLGPPVAHPAAEDTTDRVVAMHPGDNGLASQDVPGRAAPRARAQPSTGPGPVDAAHPPAPGIAPAGSRNPPSPRVPVPPPIVALEPPASALPDTLLPMPAASAPRARTARTGTVPNEQRPTTEDLPPAMLPGQPPAPPRRQASPPRTAQAAGPGSPFTQPQSAAYGQETEVHIHIGRIEVTALQEAPRPKPVTRERAQPMSLDAYLEQRRKAP